MSDLAATNCGCGCEDNCGGGMTHNFGDCNCIIWILLLLSSAVTDLAETAVDAAEITVVFTDYPALMLRHRDTAFANLFLRSEPCGVSFFHRTKILQQ